MEVKIIEDDTLTHFLGWLKERFFGWKLPLPFIETKAMTGCRLMDLAISNQPNSVTAGFSFGPIRSRDVKAGRCRCRQSYSRSSNR